MLNALDDFAARAGAGTFGRRRNCSSICLDAEIGETRRDRHEMVRRDQQRNDRLTELLSRAQ